MEEVEKRVEAVLFASGRFLNTKTIAELLEEKESAVRKGAKSLQERYDNSGGALRIIEEDDAWKVHVHSDYLELVSKLVSNTEVSGPVLETLAVIAWKSPAIQSEVVEKRGSNAYEHIKELVERGFVVKEPMGRSYKLRITEKFFDYFDVEGRDDIRAVFKEVEEEYRKKEMELELEQKRLAAALEKAEQGDGEVELEVVDIDESEKPKSDRKVSLDDMDAILEKSRATREQVGSDLDAMRPKDDEDELDTDLPDDPDEALEKAKEIREKVEEDINEL